MPMLFEVSHFRVPLMMREIEKRPPDNAEFQPDNYVWRRAKLHNEILKVAIIGSVFIGIVALCAIFPDSLMPLFVGLLVGSSIGAGAVAILAASHCDECRRRNGWTDYY